MMEPIDELLKILPPPAEPSEVPDSLEAWRDVEVKLGSKLPPDYRDFIESYGSGSIAGFIWVFSPFTKHEHINLFRSLEFEREAREYRVESGLEWQLHAVFPEEDGFLPIAATDNGDMVYWRCLGHPAEWTMAASASRGPEVELLDMGLCSFLVSILSRRITVPFFPIEFPVSRVFQPV